MSDLATNYRALADVLDELETVDVIDVDGAELLEVTDDTIQASVTITAPATPTVATSETDVEPEEEDPVDEPAEDDAGEELACDVDGCEYTGNERGLAIHEGRAHADEETPEIRCSDCGERFDSEHGLSIHRGHQHDAGDEEVASGPDSTAIGTGELTASIRPVDDFERLVEPDDHDANGAETEDVDADIQTRGFSDEDSSLDDDSERYPWVCRCGVVCDDGLQELIHKTEAHNRPQSQFNNLDAGEFQEKVSNADSVGDLADDLGWSTERVLRALGIYGFDGAVAGDGLPEDPTTACDLLTPDTDAEEAGRA